MDYDCPQPICHSISHIKTICKREGDVFYDKKNNVLCIKGEIDVFGKMFDEIKKFKIKRNITVDLESMGGGVDTAIKIADYLKKYRYTAVVYNDCISSCAQFLFIGGNKRIIAGNGRVIFHGGPFTADQILKMNPDERLRNQIILETERFKKFYIDRNISLDVLYKHPDKHELEVSFGDDVMKLMSKEEFEKYGIKVHYCK